MTMTGGPIGATRTNPPADARPARSSARHSGPTAGGRRSAGPTGEGPPTNIGPTFLSAAAILTGATALGTPISGHSWVLPLVEVVAVIWLVGVGGRLIRLPTGATVGLQLVGFVIAMTSLFTSTGIGGVLPNSSAVAEARGLLSGAWDQIVGTAPPAPSTPELSFLIALAIGCAAFIADFLVAEAAAPALVALPLLCLYSVPASIATTMLPWYSFALPAVLYAVLLAVTGHRGRRTRSRAGIGLAANGGAITALATAGALLIASAATGIGTTGRLPHTSGGGNGAIGLSPLASLRGSLAQSKAVNVLVASGLRTPDYFRTVSLSDWTNNQGWSLGPLSADIPDVDGPLNGATPLPTDSRVTVVTQGYQDRFLPILGGTSAISGLNQTWNFDAALDTVFRTDRVKPGPYLLDVRQSKPSAAELEADSTIGGGQLTETGALADSVAATAQEVTAGQTGAFDKAEALVQWFTDPANGFVYSLDVKPGDSGDALVDFLSNKQGFCEQYAAAMAVMLRSLNIPTRVAVGFTQGVRQPNGSFLITSHDAHAWVEVKFENNGWVRFDPTPPVDGQGGQQGFTASAGGTTSTTTSTAPITSGKSNALAADPTTKAGPSSAVPTASAGPTSPGGSSTRWVTVGLIVLAAVLGLGALLALPTALRLRRRRRRLTVARSAVFGSAEAAWSEIEDTAVDHGILPHPAESTRVTANRLARRAHLDSAGRARLRAVVMAAEREWYSTTPAPGLAGSPPAERSDPSVRSDGSVQSDGSVRSDRPAATVAPIAGTAPAGTGAATTTIDRPTLPTGRDLAEGVASIVRGLQENAPLRWAERIVPRSLRRTGR